MFGARVLPFWVPVSAPHQVLGGHRRPSPRTLRRSSPRQPCTSPAEGTTGSRADRLEGLCRSQLSPFLRIGAKVARPRLAPTVAGPFPPADSFCLFHSKPKVTEHATELRVHRSLTPGPPRYVKLILLPGLLGILFCFMTAGYQQVTSAKERLLHRKCTSDPCSSFPPSLPYPDFNCNLLEKFCQTSQILHCTKRSLCCRCEPAIYT